MNFILDDTAEVTIKDKDGKVLLEGTAKIDIEEFANMRVINIYGLKGR